ncbi:MAG: DNA-directed RNA polymerase subunit alpha [Bacteroidales bacterium]|jgi:DNA-directed RNA polymerase subunit alpha|nr:DNA-directed RNA polymerase subunit alpha [Bacteroidales bacterium]
MITIPFQMPEKVLMLEATDDFGVFEFRPLEKGYGITIGNALRRVLLSGLEGFAVTSVKITSVSHEFATIKGVIEDVTDIILNIKQIRFKSKIEEQTGEVVKFQIKEQTEFCAGDLNKFLNNFQILNPDLHICSMNKDTVLEMELTIDRGRGYITAEENKEKYNGVGVIVLDSTHTPIKNVLYRVENYRVEQKTDFDKLIFEIQTDGSVHPKEALKSAAQVLIQHFMLFSDDKFTEFIQSAHAGMDEKMVYMRQLLNTRLEDLNLSVRAINCLETADVYTVADLVEFQKADLLKFRNFGKKSLLELEAFLKSKNLDFGMDVAKYRLDLLDKE